jgi:hypothetical protein
VGPGIFGDDSNKLKVTYYHGNDAEGGPITHYIDPYTDYVIIEPPDDFRSLRPGFRIVSWNTDPDGRGDVYELGQNIYVTTSLTLYAIWKPNN